jgi:hypothetical protein
VGSKGKFSYCLAQKEIEKPAYYFPVYCEPTTRKLLEKIRSNSVPLSEYANVVWGVKIYQKGKGKPKQKGQESQTKMFHSSEKTKPTHKSLLGGKEINRYLIKQNGYQLAFILGILNSKFMSFYHLNTSAMLLKTHFQRY